MGRAKCQIDEDQLGGFRMMRPLRGLLEQLRDAGCARDRAGNRQLHMDQYLTLLLLFMFNPICSSLRSLQRASELPKVQKKLGVGRASLGSLSEAARVFDASLLEPVLAELVEKVGVLDAGKTPHVQQVVTLVDGSHLSTLTRISESLWGESSRRGVKMHLHYELLKGPASARISEGYACEKADLQGRLESGRLYVLDRGYAKYALLEQIVQAGSAFVCRVRNDAAARKVLDQRTPDKAAQQAGVVRDDVVDLGTDRRRRDLHRPVRLVQVHTEQRDGVQTITLATDQLDLPAEVVAHLYRLRWQVELFFRFFKHVLGCRHLVSHCTNGIELQVYAAIIASLLIALYTGRKPTKATAELFGWYVLGLADAEDLRRHIERLPAQRK